MSEELKNVVVPEAVEKPDLGVETVVVGGSGDLGGAAKPKRKYTPRKPKAGSTPEVPGVAQDAMGEMLGAVYSQLYQNFFPSQPLAPEAQATINKCWAVISKEIPATELQIAIGTLVAIPMSAIAKNYAEGKGILG